MPILVGLYISISENTLPGKQYMYSDQVVFTYNYGNYFACIKMNALHPKHSFLGRTQY